MSGKLIAPLHWFLRSEVGNGTQGRVSNPISANLIKASARRMYFSSWRDNPIVAWHEVPGEASPERTYSSMPRSGQWNSARVFQPPGNGHPPCFALKGHGRLSLSIYAFINQSVNRPAVPACSFLFSRLVLDRRSEPSPLQHSQPGGPGVFHHGHKGSCGASSGPVDARYRRDAYATLTSARSM